MMEIHPSGRAMFPTDVRSLPASGDQDARAAQTQNAEMPPVVAPEQSEKADMQPLPLPERQVSPVGTEVAEDIADSVAANAGTVIALPEGGKKAPAGLDPRTLFQGLVAEAARTGGAAPNGKDLQIYMLVQQLSTLLASVDVEPA